MIPDTTWTKRGNIIGHRRCQVPVIDKSFSDKFRLFFSDRKNNNKSEPFYIDISKDDPTKVLEECNEPILQLGKRGAFDWAGIMPTELIEHGGKKFLYYIGWSQRVDVPYHNSLGLAISTDGVNFEKYSSGPILSTCKEEPGYIGTMSIAIINGRWHGYYLSCREWIYDEERGTWEPIYDIKLALSFNGIDWKPQNITCIPLEDDEGGISQACVRKLKAGGFEMHFSVRKKTDYRDLNLSNNYRIKRAYSRDGITWTRISGTAIDVSEEGWDCKMTAYPYIVSQKNYDLLFYNGNDFGRTGVGYAIRERILQ